ncbi:hypothetical protein Tco_1059342, partial [Tanacetum coccineum]
MESQSTSTTAGAGSSSAPLRIVSFDLEKETYGENFPPVNRSLALWTFMELLVSSSASTILLLFRVVLHSLYLDCSRCPLCGLG